MIPVNSGYEDLGLSREKGRINAEISKLEFLLGGFRIERFPENVLIVPASDVENNFGEECVLFFLCVIVYVFCMFRFRVALSASRVLELIINIWLRNLREEGERRISARRLES